MLQDGSGDEEGGCRKCEARAVQAEAADEIWSFQSGFCTVDRPRCDVDGLPFPRPNELARGEQSEVGPNDSLGNRA